MSNTSLWLVGCAVSSATGLLALTTIRPVTTVNKLAMLAGLVAMVTGMLLALPVMGCL